MTENMQLDEQEHGDVNISDDVVGTIASIAAAEIAGVNGLNGGIAGDLAGIFGKKNLSKGVKITLEENSVQIDLSVIVDYGIKIPDVSWQIQENVKSAVETMTGLKVKEVNVHVTGVNLQTEAPAQINE